MSHDLIDRDQFVRLIASLTSIADELRLGRDHNNNPVLHRIEEMEHRIMSKITDWAASEQADLAAISTTLDGVVAGIAALDALITNLQNSPGALSAADQAALDAIQTASKALVTKSAAIVVTPPAA